VADDTVRRPRIEGAREQEIFGATVELLSEMGYDRLTLDLVAARARVGKASIYRRWGDKSALVDAVFACAGAGEVTLPDTGSLRGDLLALADRPDFFDAGSAALVCGLTTAIHRDPQRHDMVRAKLAEGGTKHVRALLQRAVESGDLAADVDIDLLCSVIPAMVLFRMTYQTVGTFGADLVHDIVDHILLPAVEAVDESNSHRSG
jgi:AcrR family transcriptional regulator